MQVYIPNDRPSYVVRIPLVSKGEFKACHFVPLPIPVNEDKLIHIRTEKSILCVRTKHDNITTSALILNYKKCEEPTTSKDACVNRAIPYCLV